MKPVGTAELPYRASSLSDLKCRTGAASGGVRGEAEEERRSSAASDDDNAARRPAWRREPGNLGATDY